MFFAKLRNVTESPQRPEGALIEAARQSSGMSARKVAAQVGVSDTQYRNWVRGRDARGVDARFPALGLANTARVLGVSGEDLRMAGREDAAVILERQLTRRPGDDLSDVPTEQLLAEIARRTGARDPEASGQ